MTSDVQPEDEESIRRLLRGDQHAFTTVYKKYGGPVYRFALYMSGDQALAEEITQETFLFLLANAKSYDVGRGLLLSWLLGVARNTSRRAMPKDAFITDALDDVDELEIAQDIDLHQEVAQREMIESVRRVVQSLPPALREVVILCELQELEYTEAAAVLGCPIGTIRSRLNRARALLVSKLKTGCSA
jgi:RNA polymerase sigma-70 factor (ECF subfamily)